MEGQYNLLDEHMYAVLSRVTCALDEQNIPYAIMGGIGVQVLLANAYTDGGRKQLKEAPQLDLLLRRTGDIDTIIKAELSETVRFFNQFAQDNPDLEVQNTPYRVRVGHIFINYVTSADELKGMEKHFEESVNNATEATIARRHPLSVRTQPAELIIAAKLTGHYKDKDRFDVETLIKAFENMGQRIDREKIRQIMKDANVDATRLPD